MVDCLEMLWGSQLEKPMALRKDKHWEHSWGNWREPKLAVTWGTWSERAMGLRWEHPSGQRLGCWSEQASGVHLEQLSDWPKDKQLEHSSEKLSECKTVK